MWTGRNMMNAATIPGLPTMSDIRKMGYLKKLKTNKKKLFVLRDESSPSPSPSLGVTHATSGSQDVTNSTLPARLEYYDNDKKFKAGGAAKRSIPLRACFNINKKSDAKHKYAISLYTKEDCFSVVCESEQEQEEWLSVLLELQAADTQAAAGDDDAEPRPFFEHIWQVTVKPRGLCNGKNLTAGPYRLCLTNKTLSLIRLSHHDPDIIFQLASLRRCGHSECFFFMEAGSSAVTGAGELWMQVEDTVIARNIHETILRNMAGGQPFRPRSRSSVSDRRSTKPISVPGNSRGASPGYDSSTLPVRSKTISGDPSSPTPPSRLRPGGGKGSSSGRSSTASSLGRGHSPVPTSPLGHTLSDPHRSRTDSMESRGSRGTASSLSADELDLSPHDHHSHHSSSASTRSVTPESSGMREEQSYLSMTPVGSKDILVSPTSEVRDQDSYMEMTSGISSSRDSYMDMSPGGDGAYLDMARTSFSSSPASSGHDTDDHCYYDMASVAHSLPTVQERITDAGYLDMSPGNTWSKGPIPRPERVHSYLLDDQASTEDFPKRAYSVGSKPTSVKAKDNCSYVDMTGKQVGNLDKVNQKSSSAPHLVDKEKGGHVTPDMARAVKELSGRSTVYNKELLMELDFFKKDGDNSAFRPRTSSAGREFRPRTSSFGQEMRRRAGSFGNKEGVNRTSSIGRHDRPRTTTICQDSFRNRTSSFGSTDMRPRSSSHGSRTYYKSKVSSDKSSSETSGTSDSRGSSRHSSQESLRRTLVKAAEEYSQKGGSQAESYMDMLIRRTPSPSVQSNNSTPSSRVSGDKAGVVKMNSFMHEDEYLAMTPGATSAASPETGVLASTTAQQSSYMDMNYEQAEKQHQQQQQKDPQQQQQQQQHHHHHHHRRRSAAGGDTPNKSGGGDSKSGKSRTRSSLKSQHHRLYLRMPSAETNTGAEEQGSRIDTSKSPGEYIDIGFPTKSTTITTPTLTTTVTTNTSISAKPKSIALGKQKSYDSGDDPNKAVWSPQADEYAMYAPSVMGMKMPSVGAALDPVVCPLRLDEEDDTPNASPSSQSRSPGGSLSGGSLSNTPKAGDTDYQYMEMPGANDPDLTPSGSILTLDPFALLGSMSLDSSTTASSPKLVDSNSRREPVRSTSMDSARSSAGSCTHTKDTGNNSVTASSNSSGSGRTRLVTSAKGTSSSSSNNNSNNGTTSNSSHGTSSSSTKKCPVLPPKVRSKEKSSVSSHRERTSNATIQSIISPSSTAVVSTSLHQSPTVVVGSKHNTRNVQLPANGSSRQVALEEKKSGPLVTDIIAAEGEKVVCVPPFGELVGPLSVSVTAPNSSSEPQVVKPTLITTMSKWEATRGSGGRGVATLNIQQPSCLSVSSSSLNAIESSLSTTSGKTQITSRGSTSSLTGIDSATCGLTAMSGGTPGGAGSGRHPSGGSSPAGGGLLSSFSGPVSSAVVTSSGIGTDYENLAATGRASHHSSRTSVGSDKELNYASLDLASSQDESTFPGPSSTGAGGIGVGGLGAAERTPRSPLIGKATQQPPGFNEEEETDSTPLSYAKIDFTKSEELRTATALREKMPFDVK